MSASTLLAMDTTDVSRLFLEPRKYEGSIVASVINESANKWCAGAVCRRVCKYSLRCTLGRTRKLCRCNLKKHFKLGAFCVWLNFEKRCSVCSVLSFPRSVSRNLYLVISVSSNTWRLQHPESLERHTQRVSREIWRRRVSGDELRSSPRCILGNVRQRHHFLFSILQSEKIYIKLSCCRANRRNKRPSEYRLQSEHEKCTLRTAQNSPGMATYTYASSAASTNVE